jgi:hypothetical protein
MSYYVDYSSSWTLEIQFFFRRSSLLPTSSPSKFVNERARTKSSILSNVLTFTTANFLSSSSLNTKGTTTLSHMNFRVGLRPGAGEVQIAAMAGPVDWSQFIHVAIRSRVDGCQPSKYPGFFVPVSCRQDPSSPASHSHHLSFVRL